MSLKSILKKAASAFVRSKTRGRRTPTHAQPVRSHHQSTEEKVIRGAAKLAKKL